MQEESKKREEIDKSQRPNIHTRTSERGKYKNQAQNCIDNFFGIYICNSLSSLSLKKVPVTFFSGARHGELRKSEVPMSACVSLSS